MQFLINIGRWIFWGPLRKIGSFINPGYFYVLENLFSFFSYYFLRNRKKVLTAELKKSFGSEWSSEQIKRAVRESFRIYFASKFRLFYLSDLNKSNSDKHIKVEGIENLEKSLARGKGVILLNPHFGPFMLIMPALGFRGYKVNQLSLQGPSSMRKNLQNDTAKNRLFSPMGRWLEKKAYDVRYRNIEPHMPVRFINMTKGVIFLREAYKALENNEILLFPVTGRGGKAWHTVDFMRRKALFTTVPFRMALKTGASLLPAFVMCNGNKTSVRFDIPINVDQSSTAEGLLEEYVRLLDSYVEKYPGHFLMYIYEMRMKSHWDDHPFFIDYRDDDGFKNTRRGYAQVN